MGWGSTCEALSLIPSFLVIGEITRDWQSDRARRSVEQHCHTRTVPGQRSRAPHPLWPILDRRHQKYYLRAREVPASSDVTKDLCAAAARSSSPGTLLHSMKTWDKRRREYSSRCWQLSMIISHCCSAWTCANKRVQRQYIGCCVSVSYNLAHGSASHIRIAARPLQRR